MNGVRVSFGHDALAGALSLALAMMFGFSGVAVLGVAAYVAAALLGGGAPVSAAAGTR